MDSARIIGMVARMTKDLELAEEIVQEAVLSAIKSWKQSGIPESPGAWLTTAAKHKAIDAIRRGAAFRQKLRALEIQAGNKQLSIPGYSPGLGWGSESDENVIGLMVVTCNPLLSREGRVALTLKILGGLSVSEIARAFVVPETTITQRLARAKRTLREANVAFVVPDSSAVQERLPSVLEVIYLIFNEGYAATDGADWMRPGLCEGALRLGRMLSTLVPRAAEAHALVALMEFQASRLAARTGAMGEAVLLQDQDRSRWDFLLIERGARALKEAHRLGGATGWYALQAAIAACHAEARTAAQTNWIRIVALYETLNELFGSPIVELNRAIAVSMAFGPQAGLDALELMADDPTLANYHLLAGARADCLERLGRLEEAFVQYRRAAELTGNEVQRQLLMQRAQACGRS